MASEGLILFHKPVSLKPEDKRPRPTSAGQKDLKKTEVAQGMNSGPKINLLNHLEN